MKIEEIKAIVKLMSENDLTEFKIESEDMTLCLRRGSRNPLPMPAVIAQAAPAVVSAPAASPVPAGRAGMRRERTGPEPFAGSRPW